MELTEFNSAIEKLFRFKTDRDNNHYQYYKFDEIEFRLKKKLFRETCENLSKLNSIDGYEIYNSKTYEVSLSHNNRIYYGGQEEICKEDHVNKIKYSLGIPSNEYLIFFIKNLFDLANTEGLSRPIMMYRLRNRMNHSEMDTSIELFDVLKENIPRFKTLQIKSENEKNLKESISKT